MPSHGQRTRARTCRVRPGRIPEALPQCSMRQYTLPSHSLQPCSPCTPCTHPILQHMGVEDWSYHTHTPGVTCADAEGARSVAERGGWLLGGPKQTAHTQPAAQRAARARTAMCQSWVCEGQWHMVRNHLASVCASGDRSTCAAERACCGCHGRCVSGWAQLRGSVAVCEQHTGCNMLQQQDAGTGKWRLSASCARAEERGVLLDARD